MHYDCGCIITEKGELRQYDEVHPDALTVPAVYVAYFSTFGALVSRL